MLHLFTSLLRARVSLLLLLTVYVVVLVIWRLAGMEVYFYSFSCFMMFFDLASSVHWHPTVNGMQCKKKDT